MQLLGSSCLCPILQLCLSSLVGFKVIYLRVLTTVPDFCLINLWHRTNLPKLLDLLIFCVYSLKFRLEFFIMIFFVTNQLNISKFFSLQRRKILIFYYVIETKSHLFIRLLLIVQTNQDGIKCNEFLGAYCLMYCDYQLKSRVPLPIALSDVIVLSTQEGSRM